MAAEGGLSKVDECGGQPNLDRREERSKEKRKHKEKDKERDRGKEREKRKEREKDKGKGQRDNERGAHRDEEKERANERDMELKGIANEEGTEKDANSSEAMDRGRVDSQKKSKDGEVEAIRDKKKSKHKDKRKHRDKEKRKHKERHEEKKGRSVNGGVASLDSNPHGMGPVNLTETPADTQEERPSQAEILLVEEEREEGQVSENRSMRQEDSDAETGEIKANYSEGEIKRGELINGTSLVRSGILTIAQAYASEEDEDEHGVGQADKVPDHDVAWPDKEVKGERRNGAGGEKVAVFTDPTQGPPPTEEPTMANRDGGEPEKRRTRDGHEDRRAKRRELSGSDESQGSRRKRSRHHSRSRDDSWMDVRGASGRGRSPDRRSHRSRSLDSHRSRSRDGRSSRRSPSPGSSHDRHQSRSGYAGRRRYRSRSRERRGSNRSRSPYRGKSGHQKDDYTWPASHDASRDRRRSRSVDRRHREGRGYEYRASPLQGRTREPSHRIDDSPHRHEPGRSMRRGAQDNDTEKSKRGLEHSRDHTRGQHDKDDDLRYDLQIDLSPKEEDADRAREESRKRRQAILAKYQQQCTPGNSQPGSPSMPVSGGSKADDVSPVASGDKLPLDIAKTSTAPAAAASPAMVPELAASQYDEKQSCARKGSEGAIFADDIFGDSPTAGLKLARADGAVGAALNDNWDDTEGYYCFRVGEVLDGRYEVIALHGRGVFSSVVRARDLKAGAGDEAEVAIKIIRSNETMYKAGQQEAVILKKLSGSDPENRRHCIRLLATFEYRNHLCLVFESMSMNLREVLKKFGRNVGINLAAVRSYSQQLFIALKHLKNNGVVHADVKPDNMLVNESKNVLKLCDFGSAMFDGDNEITPYLCSRFYRAPEIILGLRYDHSLDMWSVGCCLYELYAGKILFPGQSNNEMLKLQMELKGAFPKKMLRKASFAEKHFDDNMAFGVMEDDPVSHKVIKRIITNLKVKDMGMMLSDASGGRDPPKLLAAFKDLLERIFSLDPEKRIDVSSALKHSFVSGSF